MYNPYYKVCLLGEFAVGKTSLVRRFVHHQFEANYRATIGVHVTRKDVEIADGPATKITLIIWDLAGGDPDTPVSLSYYRGTAGALLVADLTRPHTVERLAAYHRAFQQVVPTAPVIALLNKADLIPSPRHLSQILTRVSATYPWPVFATSALTGMNVEEAFLALAQRIVQSQQGVFPSEERANRGSHEQNA